MFEGEFKDGKNWNGRGKKWEEIFLLTEKATLSSSIYLIR